MDFLPLLHTYKSTYNCWPNIFYSRVQNSMEFLHLLYADAIGNKTWIMLLSSNCHVSSISVAVTKWDTYLCAVQLSRGSKLAIVFKPVYHRVHVQSKCWCFLRLQCWKSKIRVLYTYHKLILDKVTFTEKNFFFFFLATDITHWNEFLYLWYTFTMAIYENTNFIPAAKMLWPILQMPSIIKHLKLITLSLLISLIINSYVYGFIYALMDAIKFAQR